MKRILLILAVCLQAASCLNFLKQNPGKGQIEISFVKDFGTKSIAIPDTNDFILSILNSNGKPIYQGKYGNAPQTVVVDAGTYTISAVSCEFDEPVFDVVQYGDTQVVRVEKSGTAAVRLVCSQVNAGIRLRISENFIAEYPSAELYLKCSSGFLYYAFSETRTAFFPAGSVCLVLKDGSEENILFTRQLAAQQVLVLNLGVASSDSGSAASESRLSICVDTSRNWTSENYLVGGSSGGENWNDAFSVSEAKFHVGEKDVWVYGYIVGGDLSSHSCSFEAPFSARTNLVIASKSSCKDKALCLSVQLPKGDVRDGLNLVDREDNLGKMVYLKGDLVESYYGIAGVQNVSTYLLK